MENTRHRLDDKRGRRNVWTCWTVCKKAARCCFVSREWTNVTCADCLKVKDAQSSMMDRKNMETRRLAGAAALLEGMSQAAAAKKFGVSRTTTSRWNRVIREQGITRLNLRRATGRPPWLNAVQLARVEEIFRSGPAAYGLKRWTGRSIGSIIESEFGVAYNADHVGRLLLKLNLRRPRGTAVEQDVTTL
jgi:transposase